MDALKLLQEPYLGKVKMIYIDLYCGSPADEGSCCQKCKAGRTET